MDSLPRSLRIGVVDFPDLRLSLALRLEQKLVGAATFFYFFCEPPPEAALRLEGREWRDWQPHTASPTVTLSEAELLDACGRHQLLRAESLPALLRRAHELLNRLDCFITETRAECLLVWNGQENLGGALAGYLARRRGLKLVFMEQGALPQTLRLDRRGVHYGSEFTPRIAAGEYRDFEPDERLLDECLARLRIGGVTPPTGPASAPDQFARELAQCLQRAMSWRSALSPFRARLPPGVRHYVLLPAQSLEDVQLSEDSPLLGNDIERLLMEVYLAMRQALPQHRLVVRIDALGSAETRRGCERVAARLPDVLFVENQPMHELLQGCALLVTVNSPAGIEALAFGKPVVTLGRSYYAVPELVRPVTRLDALPQALRVALDHPPPMPLVRRFLGFLQQRMCARGSASDLGEGSVEGIATRLLELAREPLEAWA